MTTPDPKNTKPESPADVAAERSAKLRARIRSIVDELAADHPVEWTPELLASTFTVPGPTQTHPKGATHE